MLTFTGDPAGPCYEDDFTGIVQRATGIECWDAENRSAGASMSLVKGRLWVRHSAEVQKLVEDFLSRFGGSR